MSSIGNILATFCGHDHENDYYIKYKNMELHFGRRTYYNPPPKAMLDGCKVIEFDSNTKSFTTWIRNENNEKEIQTLSNFPTTKPSELCFNKYNKTLKAQNFCPIDTQQSANTTNDNNTEIQNNSLLTFLVMCSIIVILVGLYLFYRQLLKSNMNYTQVADGEDYISTLKGEDV